MWIFFIFVDLESWRINLSCKVQEKVSTSDKSSAMGKTPLVADTRARNPSFYYPSDEQQVSITLY